MPYKDKQKRKEKAKEYSRKHYLKNKEEVIKRTAEWKKNNSEANRMHSKTAYYKDSDVEGVTNGVLKRRKYRENNREKIKETNRNWREKNKEHLKQYNKEYKQKNK